MAEIAVKGPGAAEAQRLVEQQKTFDIEFDNSDGVLTGPKDKRLYQGIPGASMHEAAMHLQEYLRSSGQYKDPYGGGSPVSATVQRGLELGAPSLAAAITGAYSGGNPLLAGAARAGTYAGTQALQAYTQPERFQEEVAGNIPGQLGETALQGLEGAAAEYAAGAIGQRFPELANAPRTLAQRILRGPNYRLNPEQERILGPGGPFQEGAAQTGVEAFPPPETYTRPGFFRTIREMTSKAFGARGRTALNAEQLAQNLDAQTTHLAQYITSAEDPRDVARALNMLAGFKQAGGRFKRGAGVQAVDEYVSGLYQAVDQQVADLGGTGLNTGPLIQYLQRTPVTGGQRTGAVAEFEQRLTNALEGRPRGPVTRRQESTTTREVTQQASNTPNAQIPQITETTQDIATTTTSPRQTTQQQQTGQATTTTYTNPYESTTQGIKETTTNPQALPLQGRLHTVGPNGVDTTIPIGEARQISDDIGRIIRDADPRTEQGIINVATGFKRQLDQQINQALDALDPALVRGYRAADTFTAHKYETVRKETLVKALDELADNPSRLRDYFWRDGGLDRLDDLRASLASIDHVDVPSSGFMSGTRFFEERLAPALRYQLLERASTPVTAQNLPAAVQDHAPLRELIDNGQLVALQPGKIHDMAKDLGKQHFEALVGGPTAARQFLDLDRAYLDAQKAAGGPEHLFILMAQTGGVSRASGAAGTLAGAALGSTYAGTQGSLAATAAVGLGAGTLLVLTPGILNRMTTTPTFFRNVILGVRQGPDSPLFSRLVTQFGTTAAEEGIRAGLDARRRSQVQQGPVQQYRFPLSDSLATQP